jgi:enamine deaminase RidA (YjgF/YER057c/UK114 family)
VRRPREEGDVADIVPLRVQQDRWNGDLGSWAQVYRQGNTVLMQGQTGLTLDGDLVFPYDAAGQTRQALDNIRELMRLAGGELKDVAKIVVYVTDRAHRAKVYPIIAEYFGAMKPCSTGIIVAGLALPELVMEIDAYGFIPD